MAVMATKAIVMVSFLVVAAGILLSGCLTTQSPAPAQNGSVKLQIVASFYPIYFLSSQIVGDNGTAESLVPSGVEPHDFELGPSDMKKILSADIVFYNGLGLEQWIGTASNALGSNASLVDVSTGIEPITATGAVGIGNSPSSTGIDPHVWLDPIDAKAEAANIERAIESKDPENAEYYRGNLRALQGKLDAIDSEYRSGLANCKKREIITSHAAFGYVAAQYNLTQVPIAGLSPETEPSPSQLASLVAFARSRNATYIFFESLVNPALSDTIAREIGAKTLVLDPIEGLTPENQRKAKDYLSLLKDNLANLRTALDCT